MEKRIRSPFPHWGGGAVNPAMRGVVDGLYEDFIAPGAMTIFAVSKR